MTTYTLELHDDADLLEEVQRIVGRCRECYGSDPESGMHITLERCNEMLGQEKPPRHCEYPYDHHEYVPIGTIEEKS